MSEKRFTWKTEKLQHLDEEVLMVVDNENKEWKGHILNIVDMLNELSDDNRQLKKLLKGNNEKFGKCWDRIHSLEKENEQLRKYNGQLKERLERINGGYGHLTHRNGLTANEWLIESQEKELKKKNEQISDLKEENEQLKQQIKIEKKWQLEKDRYYVDLHKRYDNLEKENERLRQMIKENVFGKYREGSLADLEFKAIAYDDIVKLEVSNESEPKVIIICKSGKKENVKSFCQMFIPFKMYYEIKELEDE